MVEAFEIGFVILAFVGVLLMAFPTVYLLRDFIDDVRREKAMERSWRDRVHNART